MAGFRAPVPSWAAGLGAVVVVAADAGFFAPIPQWPTALASVAGVAAAGAGFRSVLGFWMGGVASSDAVVPVPRAMRAMVGQVSVIYAEGDD